MGQSNLLGAWGETLAAEYMRKKRFKLNAMNYRCKFGEIDLIVSDKNYLVFVEVKLRKNASFAQAHEFVDVRKQQKIRMTAEMYLVDFPTLLQPRFDVIEIYAPEGMSTQHPIINHKEDAF